ncbi:MAG: hypothetical protein GY719_17205 [bacterium]|nr:hypothetical protein [bacterium]
MSRDGVRLPELPLHDDEPTLDDQLDRTELIDQVCEMVACGKPPQVLGVHGDWGSGKTSFLHQLQWRLTGECPQQPKERLVGMLKPEFPYKNVTVVWFEAFALAEQQLAIAGDLVDPVVFVSTCMNKATLKVQQEDLDEANLLMDAALKVLGALAVRLGLPPEELQKALLGDSKAP